MARVTLNIGETYQFDGFTAKLDSVYDGSFFFWADKPIEREVNDGTRIGAGYGFHVRNNGAVARDRDGCKVSKVWEVG